MSILLISYLVLYVVSVVIVEATSAYYVKKEWNESYYNSWGSLWEDGYYFFLIVYIVCPVLILLFFLALLRLEDLYKGKRR